MIKYLVIMRIFNILLHAVINQFWQLSKNWIKQAFDIVSTYLIRLVYFIKFLAEEIWGSSKSVLKFSWNEDFLQWMATDRLIYPSNINILMKKESALAFVWRVILFFFFFKYGWTRNCKSYFCKVILFNISFLRCTEAL